MKNKHNLGSFLFYQSIIFLVLKCFTCLHFGVNHVFLEIQRLLLTYSPFFPP